MNAPFEKLKTENWNDSSFKTENWNESSFKTENWNDSSFRCINLSSSKLMYIAGTAQSLRATAMIITLDM